MFAAALDAGTPCWWVAGDEVYGNAPKLRLPRRARYRVRARGGQGPPDHDRHRHAQGRLTAAEAVLAAAQRLTRPPKASGCTTGPGSRPPTPRWPAPRASTSCWSGAPSAPASWRSIAPTHHDRQSWPHWWESPAAVGRSKKRSSPARSSPPWTNTRPAPGPPGAAGRCWPCSLTLLTVMAATGPTRHTNDGLITLTRNEIRRPQPLRRPVGEILHRLHWSRWRRRHQARAHACHSADRKHNSHDHDLRLEY